MAAADGRRWRTRWFLGVGDGRVGREVSRGAGAGAAHDDGPGACPGRDQQVTCPDACLDQLPARQAHGAVRARVPVALGTGRRDTRRRRRRIRAARGRSSRRRCRRHTAGLDGPEILHLAIESYWASRRVEAAELVAAFRSPAVAGLGYRVSGSLPGVSRVVSLSAGDPVFAGQAARHRSAPEPPAGEVDRLGRSGLGLAGLSCRRLR
jgi:hypothetical protein